MGQGSPLVRDCPWTAHSMRHSGLFGLLVFGVALVGCSSASRSLPHVAVQPPLIRRSRGSDPLTSTTCRWPWPILYQRIDSRWKSVRFRLCLILRNPLPVSSQEKTTSEVDCTFHVPNPSPTCGESPSGISTCNANRRPLVDQRLWAGLTTPDESLAVHGFVRPGSRNSHPQGHVVSVAAVHGENPGLRRLTPGAARRGHRRVVVGERDGTIPTNWTTTVPRKRSLAS